MDMKKLGSGAAVAALAIVLAGCGSSSSGSGGKTAVAAGSGTGPAASGLTATSTSIGKVLVNGAGHTVYELNGDTASNPLCTASCQAFWPPVTSGGTPVVVNGHPVFTFAEDSGAGQTHGQGVTDTWGTWYALDAKGNPLLSGGKPVSSPSSSSSSGGGYGY